MVERHAILSVRDIRKSFRGIKVLEGVSFDIEPGTITALVGSNGAGKSTLVNVLTGMLEADGGEVRLAGKLLGGMPAYRRARAGLLRTFQHPRVFGSFSVAESLQLARTPPAAERFGSSLAWVLKGRRSPAAVEPGYPVEQHLVALASVPAAQLSYGQKKLLMLSQVLAANGSVLCFDELCAGLEQGLAEEVRLCLIALAQRGKAIIFVEHNLALVRSLASRVIFLHQGRVFRDGPVDEVLTDPEVVSMYLGE
jgi:ABC-type branched-subunit amino acid transport system ATPase component